MGTQGVHCGLQQFLLHKNIIRIEGRHSINRNPLLRKQRGNTCKNAYKRKVQHSCNAKCTPAVFAHNCVFGHILLRADERAFLICPCCKTKGRLPVDLTGVINLTYTKPLRKQLKLHPYITPLKPLPMISVVLVMRIKHCGSTLRAYWRSLTACIRFMTVRMIVLFSWV